MPGVRAAMKYAYSNTRIKAMESKLIGKDKLERMLAAKEAGSIAAMLLQTDYKADIEKLGGVRVMEQLVDFALSRNLGRQTGKLISIAPKDQRNIITAIAGVWDVNNIKLVLEAVGSGKGFEDISRYVIESRYVSSEAVKEAIGAKSVDGAIDRLTRRTPYAKLLQGARDAYRKTHNPIDAGAAVERVYYTQLGSMIGRLARIDRDAAALIRKRIDMRNILTLMQAKKHGMDFSKISDYILSNGSLSLEKLEKLFKNAKSIESLAENVKTFNLKTALASYEESKSKPLLIFEIAMLNEVFASALRSVRHSVLSFGVIIAFLYLKEIEVFTLRVLIKGKSYGLSDKEIKEMISWLR